MTQLSVGPGAQIFFSQQAAEVNYPGEGYYLYQHEVRLKDGTTQTRLQWKAEEKSWYQRVEDRLSILEAKI